MTFYRPGQDTGSGRFWLALSLSTVTAAAVAVPLALTAVSADSDSNNAPVAPAEVEDIPQAPTTSERLLPSIQVFQTGQNLGTIEPAPVVDPAGATTSSTPPITIPEPSTTQAAPTTQAPSTIAPVPTTTVAAPTSSPTTVPSSVAPVAPTTDTTVAPGETDGSDENDETP